MADPISSGFTLRRVRPSDGGVLSKVRLAALLDTPSAFGSTYAAEALLTAADWEQRCIDRSSGDLATSFLAFDDHGDPVGIIGGFRADPTSTVIDLVSMWVAPPTRGTDVADRLVAEVVAFAREQRCGSVELWVTVGNDRARRFYERNGFVALDDFAPLPSDPCKNEQRMRLTL